MFSADEINCTEVRPEVLETVLERVSKLAPEDRGFEGSTITAIHVVNELGLSEEQRRQVGLAVNFRLMALARLMEENGAPGWTLPGSDDSVLIHQEVIARAASQPLRAIDNELVFDAEEFSADLLRNTELGGTA